MDSLQISGKWYISSRRAAKENGYHVDYIGQLIRAGKIKGQKVGHSWYVSADSLSQYLDNEQKVSSSKKKSAARTSMHTAEIKKEKIVTPEISAVSDFVETSNTSGPDISKVTTAEESIESIEATESTNQFSNQRISLVPKDEYKVETTSNQETVALQENPQTPAIPPVATSPSVEIKLMTYLPDENSDSIHRPKPIQESKVTANEEQRIPIHRYYGPTDISQTQKIEEIKEVHKKPHSIDIYPKAKLAVFIVFAVFIVIVTVVCSIFFQNPITAVV